MVDSIGDVPAYVVGRHADVLSWNPLAHALLAGHLAFDAPHDPADRPNYPDDSGLAALIDELTTESPEFASLWSAHPVHQCAYSTQRHRHPLVGPMTLEQQVMNLPQDDGQQLIVITAPTRVALARGWAVRERDPRPRRHSQDQRARRHVRA